MLISVDWVPPYWCPSRRLLRSRREDPGLVTRSKVTPKTGAASPPMTRARNHSWFASSSVGRGAVTTQRHRSRDRPREGRHLPRDGNHDLVHVLAPGAQPSIPLAEP